MRAVLTIAGHELVHAFRTSRSLISGLVFFSLCFLAVNTLAGAFDSIKIMLVGENSKLNSPFILSVLLSYLTLAGATVLAIISGRIALKDSEYNSLPLTYTLPVTRLQLLGGKLVAALAHAAFVFLCAVLGLLSATAMPYLDQSQFGPVTAGAYLLPLLRIVLPNVFFLTALFFMLATVFRSYFVNWLAVIVLYALFYAAVRLSHQPGYSYLAGLLDPFGIQAVTHSGVGLSDGQLNSSDGLSRVLVVNRIIWIALGMACCLLAYRRFSFQRQPSLRRAKASSAAQDIAPPVPPHDAADVRFDPQARRQQFIFLVRCEWAFLFRNRYFKIILGVGLLLLIISSLTIHRVYDTDTYPVTYHVCEVFTAATRLLLFVVIAVFSGEMVWRERTLNAHLVGDALPVGSAMRYFSKILALTAVVFLLGLLLIPSGLLLQHVSGYHNHELSVFLQLIPGIEFTSVLFTIALAFAVHASAGNRFTGYLVLLAGYCFQSFFADALFEDDTFHLNASPVMKYSDMDHFGYNVPVFIIYRLHWLLLAAILLLVTARLYPCGIELGIGTRFRQFKEQLRRRRYARPLLLLLAAFLLSGGFIYYNIHVRNSYLTMSDLEQRQADDEKRFSAYRSAPQPVTTGVSIHAELYPENGSLTVAGRYWIKNNTRTAIPELYVNLMEADSVWLQVACQLRHSSTGIRIFRLGHPLAPGDSLKLLFYLVDSPNGFANRGVSSIVRSNGTFFSSGIFPLIGYDERAELQSNSRRRKYGLAEKQRFARALNDPEGIATNLLGQKALIRLSITAGTSRGQTVVAPGRLMRQWTQNGRNYVLYRSERAVNHFYSVLSAAYRVERDVWESGDSTGRKVDLSIYHHPAHRYNIGNMMAGMKEALGYHRRHFAPYQYSDLRIVEFPRHAMFAQSFPGCIPFSEDIGFVADLRNVTVDSATVLEQQEAGIDYPFYVTAHEVAHQWWAHQVCAANVEGASFIVETLSQYSALMVMKHHYGEERMRSFLTHEKFSYLSARSGGVHGEQPLETVAADEQAVFYRKGAVVMYALQDYLGETTVNAVLKRYLQKYAFKNAPYPNSSELIREFEKVTPDSLKYIIADWFRNITLYQATLGKASYSTSEDLDYTVHFTVTVNKYKYDRGGRENLAAVSDYLPVGIYNAKGKQLYLGKIKVRSGLNSIRLRLGRRPEILVLDPYNLLLDKDWMIKKVTLQAEE